MYLLYDIVFYYLLICIVLVISLFIGLIKKDRSLIKQSIIGSLIFALLGVSWYIVEFNISRSPQHYYKKAITLADTYYYKEIRKYDFSNPLIRSICVNYSKKALELDPELELARIELAEFYLHTKKYSNAIQECNKLSEATKMNNTRVMKIEGMAYMFLGNYDAAKQIYNNLLQKNEEFERLYLLLNFGTNNENYINDFYHMYYKLLKNNFRIE